MEDGGVKIEEWRCRKEDRRERSRTEDGGNADFVPLSSFLFPLSYLLIPPSSFLLLHLASSSLSGRKTICSSTRLMNSARNRALIRSEIASLAGTAAGCLLLLSRVDLVSEQARMRCMDKTKTVELTGRAGNWVALKGDSYEVVAEGRTLKEVAGKARRRGIRNPTFARIPRKDCALIL
jgi:hypothetical protein